MQFKDADVFVGLSVKGAFTQEMLRSMAARADRLCHGQSGPGNHVRGRAGSTQGRAHVYRANGLSQPGEQRARLSVYFPRRTGMWHATAINEEMKLAATKALAALAKEDVPDSVCHAYGVDRIQFGPEYIIRNH